LRDPVGRHQRLGEPPARLPDPFHLGVQPQVRIPALQRPLPEAASCSSSPRHSRETWSLLIPATPSCSTSRSTRRVLTPLTEGSRTTPTSPRSAPPRGSTKHRSEDPW